VAGKGNVEIVAVAVIEQPVYTGMHVVASALAGMAAGSAMLILPIALGWW